MECICLVWKRFTQPQGLGIKTLPNHTVMCHRVYIKAQTGSLIFEGMFKQFLTASSLSSQTLNIVSYFYDHLRCRY